MNKNVVHTTVLLQALISMLHDEGIDINTSAALNIEKVLFNTDLNVYDTFSKLKYRMVPIIGRNKEEQDSLYKIFDRLDDKIKKKEQVIIEPPNTNGSISHEAESEILWKERLKKFAGSKKFWVATIIAAAILAIAIYILTIPPSDISPPTAKVGTNFDPVLKDTVEFTSDLPQSQRKKYQLEWRFRDTVIKNQWKVTRIIKDTGSLAIKTFLTDVEGKVVDSFSTSYPVLCEKPPDLSIQKIPDQYIERWPGKGAVYAAIIINPSKDSGNYKYNWYVNNVGVKGDRILTTRSKYNENVRLFVTWDSAATHCSTDSLGAEINDEPAISAVVTGDKALQIKKTTDWKNVGMSLLWLIIVPLIPAFIVYETLRRMRTPEQQKEAEAEPEIEGPYSINFKNHEHAIHTEHKLEKLTDVLRKRQISEVTKLNIRRTIYNTVRSGGLPQLAYVPLTKPSDYLVFIEKGNPDSYLANLFNYLLEKLKKDQVNLDVYEYQKEPLFLSNEKLNHHRIPVDKIAALYPGRTLFIFGDTRHFVFSLKGKLKDWVTTKLDAWKTKIIVTPWPKNDWDKKEQLLTEANFIVIPADMEAEPVVEAVVNGQVDIPSQSRFVVPLTYPARALNFQEFESLKAYLNDENLLRWVCSLAVYPSINWNLTLAIGKAIENNLQQKGQVVELVNYTNLLKLGRISWIEEGIITDTIRIQMLEYLDNETEALARQTLVDQLGDLKDKILPNSLLKREFDVQEKVNSFLVSSYKNEKISTEDFAFVRDALAKDHLDQTHEIYLKKGRNTLLKLPNKKDSDVSIDNYFEAVDKKKRNALIMTHVVAYVIFSAIAFFILRSNTALLQWTHVQPSRQTFVFTHPDMLLDDMRATISTIDSAKVFDITRDTVQLADMMITDTSKPYSFTITTADNKPLSQDSIKLNSNQYTVFITRPVIVPATIYYNNASDLSLANTIEENLPPNFQVTVQQKRSADTATSITYFDEAQKKDAELAGSIISKLLNKNIQASGAFSKSVKSKTNTGRLANESKKSLEISVANPPGCTPVAVNALPKTLTEIWKGETNNRLVNINLQGNLLCYSTGGKTTYGTYRISEVCLMKTGTYKIVSKTDKGYSVFFIRNIIQQGYELSFCQQPFKTREEIQSIDETYCGAFYSMSLYYENNPSVIYLPVKSGVLVKSEKAKLKKIEDSIRSSAALVTRANIPMYDVGYVQRDYIRANKYLPGPNSPLPGQYLANIGTFRKSTRGDIAQTVPFENPFQRYYFTIKLDIERKKLADPTIEPNCNKTFYSIAETQKEESHLIICKLDLSGVALLSVPPQVYTFTNLKELNFGTSSIAQDEIDKLRKALPKCNIIIQRANKTANDPPNNVANREVLLGTIYLDGKRYPTPESLDLIKSIAGQLSNSKRQIRLEATYSNKREQAEMNAGIKTIRDLLTRAGAKLAYNQVTEKITESQPQKQMQQAGNPSGIRVYGINFEEKATSS